MTRYQLLHLATLLVVLALAVVALQAVAWVNRVGDIHGSLLSRLSIYEQGAQLWLKGIVFGVGAGTFEVVLPVVNTDPVLAEKLWTKAHSTYRRSISARNFRADRPLCLRGCGSDPARGMVAETVQRCRAGSGYRFCHRRTQRLRLRHGN